ncbi:MAG: AAA family ATPase [Candidatus Aminicenantes bacterium]|nr:AAA family ATPase [Candidatus Aminicenantes bacterium]
MRIIGLTGTNGSGKGAAAEYFISKGYAFFSLSDVIREELKKDGFEPTRDNLIRKGNELRSSGGADFLARQVMKKVEGKAVIDSIRNPEEVRFLKSNKNFILLAIDADAELRYERVKKRGRNESAATLQEFIKKEDEEKTENPMQQQLHTCFEMADFKILNEGSLVDLTNKLEEFL